MSFADLTRQADDLVDAHLGDPLTLTVSGTDYALEGTLGVEEVEQFVDGALSIVTRQYVSVQERRVPTHLAQRGGVITRADPYRPGEPLERYRVTHVDRTHSGRVRIGLAELEP